MAKGANILKYTTEEGGTWIEKKTFQSDFQILCQLVNNRVRSATLPYSFFTICGERFVCSSVMFKDGSTFDSHDGKIRSYTRKS